MMCSSGSAASHKPLENSIPSHHSSPTRAFGQRLHVQPEGPKGFSGSRTAIAPSRPPKSDLFPGFDHFIHFITVSSLESLSVTVDRPVCDLKPRDEKVTLKNQVFDLHHFIRARVWEIYNIIQG